MAADGEAGVVAAVGVGGCTVDAGGVGGCAVVGEGAGGCAVAGEGAGDRAVSAVVVGDRAVAAVGVGDRAVATGPGFENTSEMDSNFEYFDISSVPSVTLQFTLAKLSLCFFLLTFRLGLLVIKALALSEMKGPN